MKRTPVTATKFRTVSHGISGVPDSTVIIANLGNHPAHIAIESLKRLTGWDAARIARAVPNGVFHKVPVAISGTSDGLWIKFVNAQQFARKACGEINDELCRWIARLNEGMEDDN